MCVNLKNKIVFLNTFSPIVFPVVVVVVMVVVANVKDILAKLCFPNRSRFSTRSFSSSFCKDSFAISVNSLRELCYCISVSLELLP